MIPPIPMPPPSYDETIDAVVACGVSVDNIRISYEASLQSDVVAIRDLGATDGPRLLCVRQAVHPYYIVHVEDEDQRHAFEAVIDRTDRRHQRAEAVEWLQTNAMLDRVPRFEPERGLQAFARSLENACDLSPGSAIEVYGETILTFRREFLEQNRDEAAHDRWACLTLMVAASNADEYDIRVGFIGNEPISENGR